MLSLISKETNQMIKKNNNKEKRKNKNKKKKKTGGWKGRRLATKLEIRAWPGWTRFYLQPYSKIIAIDD